MYVGTQSKEKDNIVSSFNVEVFLRILNLSPELQLRILLICGE